MCLGSIGSLDVLRHCFDGGVCGNHLAFVGKSQDIALERVQACTLPAQRERVLTQSVGVDLEEFRAQDHD